MVSKRKREYMRDYNQRDYVKLRKADYMQRIRAELVRQRARENVLAFLRLGYENQAFEYAREFAPEMLLTIRARTPSRKAV